MIVSLVPAAGAKTVVTLHPTGLLRSHSAAVETIVSVQCAAPKAGTVTKTATLTVRLTQHQGNVVVTHSESDTYTGANFPCDGKVHNEYVAIVTPRTSGVFNSGPAAGLVAFKVCDPTCTVASTARTITIQ
jgi:hypothetical protein